MLTSKKRRGHKRFCSLEKRLGYKFRDYDNIEQALTHASARKGSNSNFHYERLEFLGDRVLGLIVAGLLFRHYPKADEGELSLRLNSLVKGKTLSRISDDLNLYEFIRAGGDLKKLTDRRMQNVRADVLEAVIASIFLDGGLKAAEEFVVRFWSEHLFNDATARRDSKTELQEWSHANNLGSPKYCMESRAGPDHDPVFTITVQVGDREEVSGTGSSKRAAEQDAASRMLVREGVWTEEELVN